MALLKQSTAYTRTFKMISSTDHFSLKTGAAPVVNISKAGAAFGVAAGAVTEVASGWYKVALSAADTGTVGDLSYYITGTGADDTDFVDQVYVRSIDDLAFPATSGRSLAVDASGRALADVDTIKTNPVVNGGTITFPTTATLASTTNITAGTITTATNLTTNNDKTGYALTTLESLSSHAGTAQAGAVGSITLAAGASATDSLYVGSAIKIYGGTGAGQTRVISAYVGATKVATVPRNWTTAPDNTSLYSVLALAVPKVNDSLEVTASAVNGNVTGSVGSVVGAVGSVTGAVGSVTGNVGGNVVGSVASVVGAVGSVTGLTAANLDTTVSSRLAAASYTTPPTANENADGLLARNVAGGSSAGRLVKEALYVLRNKTDIAAGTLTVYAVDDATPAFTAVVTTAAGNPITGLDPA